jgi:NTE family protein
MNFVESPILREHIPLTPSPPIKRRLGLALSGGGTRGLAHIGVLQAFEEAGVRPDCISGTSIGAFAAALYAFGVPLREIREVGRGMSPISVSKLNLSRYALFSNEEIGRLIQGKIGKARIEEARTPLAIVAVDIATGEKVVMREGEAAPAVMASNAVPGLFRPIVIDGRLMVDGGIAEDVPISPLQAMGADVVVAVNLSAERWYSRPNDIIDVILNAIDIAIDENTKVQVRQADVLIEPQLHNFPRMDVSKIDELIAEGYRATKAGMDAIKRLLEGAEEKKPASGM